MRQMNKHIINDFYSQFSTCFSVWTLSSITKKQDAQWLGPPASPGLLAPQLLLGERLVLIPVFTGDIYSLELVSLCT